jgi:hypothetical protein
VNCVETTGFLFGKSHGLDSNDFEVGFVDAREDFPLKIAPDGVGLDDREGALQGQDILS